MKVIDLTISNIILFIVRLIFLPVKFVNYIVYGHAAPVIVGYCWYSKEEYGKMLKANEDDQEQVEFRTYEQWLDFATARIKELEGQKWIVIKINIQTKKMQNWLRKNSLKNTAENREEYAAYRIRDLNENGIN